MPPITRLLLLCLLTTPLGCTKTLTADRSPTGVPVPFELSMLAIEKDQRQAYYRIEADRTFHFGGGKQAIIRESTAIGKLTDEQALQVWRIIDRHDLTHGKGAMPFAGFERHRYELRIRAAGDRCNYTTVDDRTPGIDELAAKLFEFQAGIRYRDVFGPIEETIEKSGGAVKKTSQ